MNALQTELLRQAMPQSVDSAAAACAADVRAPVVAIVGRPNVGKSTFFAAATSRFAETANLPGTTVGIDAREVVYRGRRATFVDLPGTLGLDDTSDGLGRFWQLLLRATPDALVLILDAGDVARHLPLVLACRDLGLPIVVAANLADEAAARGIDLDLGRLSQLLGAPVHRTIGRNAVGVDAVFADALRLATDCRLGGRRANLATPYGPALVKRVRRLAERVATDGEASLSADLLAFVRAGLCTPVAAATIGLHAKLELQRWDVAERWARQVETRRDVRPPLAERIGRQITSPWPGLPVFVTVLAATLGITMAAGTLLSAILAGAWQAFVSPPLSAAAHALMPAVPLSNATLWAVDSGLLAMLSVGIPYVLTFYLLLAVLEDSGYLAATAVLTDRLFNVVGLPGRAALPILAATGCNVPAIYGTRVLESRRERLLASFLIVITPCSARSAVVIAALAPFAGPLVALGAFGVVALVGVSAGVAANRILPGRQSPLILELPPLRRPMARHVAAKAWFRFRAFVRTATPVMLIGSFVLGLAYEAGLVTPLAALADPAFEWLLGLPGIAGIALVLAFLRKELALQLLLVLAIAAYGAGTSSLATFMSNGQLFVYAIVTAVSIPCAATLATLVDEFGWPAAGAITAAVLGLALAVGVVAARLVGIA
jgi:ferrous iron transport protein B